MSDNRAASRPQSGVLTQPVRLPSRRTLLAAFAAALLAGGAFLLWKHLVANPPPWMARWRVQRYLKQEAHTSRFQVPHFVFPSKEEMSRKPTPESSGRMGKSGKSFDALREEYFALKTAALTLEDTLARHEEALREARSELDLVRAQLAREPAEGTNTASLRQAAALLGSRIEELEKKPVPREELAAKEAALAPIVADLWEFQRAWLAESGAAEATGTGSFASSRAQFTAETRQKLEKAATYAEIYHLIGQELWIASRLLQSANPEHIRSGVSFALSASRHALHDAQNGWVAARIVEGYILPHLDVANDTNRRSPFHRDNLLRECADIFRQNNEHRAVVRTYKSALAQADTPQKADSARAQIAMAYEEAGDPRQALRYLRQIQDTNDYRWIMRRVPRLEQQVTAN